MRLLNAKIIAVGGFHVTTGTVIDVILPFPSGSKSTAPGDRLRLAPEHLHTVSLAPYTSFFRRTIIIYYCSVNALCLHALGRIKRPTPSDAHAQTSGANVRRPLSAFILGNIFNKLSRRNNGQ